MLPIDARDCPLTLPVGLAVYRTPFHRWPGTGARSVTCSGTCSATGAGTAAEARQLAADWAGLLAAFADRVDDPRRRPAGAVPFELVVLGRQVPDLVGAARGLPGPGQAS